MSKIFNMAGDNIVSNSEAISIYEALLFRYQEIFSSEKQGAFDCLEISIEYGNVYVRFGFQKKNQNAVDTEKMHITYEGSLAFNVCDFYENYSIINY